MPLRALIPALSLVAIALCMAPSALADPAWFPREVLAYAEVRAPRIGWVNPEIRRIMNDFGIRERELEKGLRVLESAAEGLLRIEGALIDIRANEDLPITFAVVQHYNVDRDAEWLMNVLREMQRSAWDGDEADGQPEMPEIPRTPYRGFDLLGDAEQPGAVAVGGKLVIWASGVPKLKETIDAIAGDAVAEDMLPANHRFARWNQETQFGDHLARVFVDTVAAFRVMDQAIGDTAKLGREEFAALYTGQWLEWRKLSYVSATVANDNLFTTRADLVFTQDPAWAPVVKGGRHDGTKYAHPKSVFVASFSASDIRGSMDIAERILSNAEAEKPKAPPAKRYRPRSSATKEGAKPTGDGPEYEEYTDPTPRDMFGEQYRAADRYFKEMGEVVADAWQFALERYEADGNDPLAPATPQTLADATDLTWIAAPFVSYRAASFTVTGKDPATGKFTGTVKYQHADGSYFDVPLPCPEDDLKVIDPVAEKGPFPDDPETGKPMTPDQYAQLRRDRRGIPITDLVIASRSILPMMFGISEAEFLAITGENMVVGIANNDVQALMSGRSDAFEDAFYFIVPLRNGERARTLFERFATSTTGQQAFSRRSSRDQKPAGEFWNTTIGGTRVRLPENRWDPAIAITNDALIFASPGLLPGIIEGAKGIGAASRHGLDASKGAVAMHFNPRWLIDADALRRSPVNNIIPNGVIENLPMNASVRFDAGRIVAEFALWRPIEPERIRVPEIFRHGTDEDEISKIHDACCRILDMKQAETGERPKEFPSWDEAVDLIGKETMKMLEESRARRKADGEEDIDPEIVEVFKEHAREQFNRESALFPGVMLRDAYTLKPMDAANYESLFADPKVNRHTRVIAVSRQPWGSDRVIIATSQSRQRRGNDYNNQPLPQTLQVTPAYLEKISKATNADGSIPPELLDRHLLIKLTDIEAATNLPQFWGWQVTSIAQELYPRWGRGKDQPKPTGSYTDPRLGVVTYLEDKKDAATGTDSTGTPKPESKPGDGDKEPDPDAGPDFTKAVVRVEAFGHWADFNLNGEIVNSSWAQNLAALAEKERRGG